MDSATKKKYMIGGVATVVVVAIIVILAVTLSGGKENDFDSLTTQEKAQKILESSPIIDGHNDFPWNLRSIVYNDLRRVNFSSDLSTDPVWGPNNGSHTDIPRLRKGHVGAQFWVAYTSCSSQYKDSVEQTIEQIDVIRRLAANYSSDLVFATSADDIEEAFKNNKIASLVAVEGGHSIQFSMGILRTIYQLGARYMTLTHSCNTPWGDASPVDIVNGTLKPQSNGLSQFGLEIVDEMNRLGMMIDLSHVSKETMIKALDRSKAPVIFSHSSAHAICQHHRNVQDDVLLKIKETKSIIMVNFYSRFIQCNASLNATIDDVVAHIEHIRNITGPDHIGVGGDYDGVDETPVGLEDVSKYPALIEALLDKGWSRDDLEKLAGKNLIRVFRAVEKVRDELKSMDPIQDSLKSDEIAAYNANYTECITAKFEKLPQGSLRRNGRLAVEEGEL